MSIALGRAGHPREVAELVAFLLSERAAYLTGASVNIKVSDAAGLRPVWVRESAGSPETLPG